MFEDFSGGYYLGRLYVEPHEVERPAIHDDEYEAMRSELYEGSDKPLVMKLDNHHLAVGGDEGVPSGTLGIPERLLEETGVEKPPVLKGVLLAKQGYAERILNIAGEEERVGGEGGV